MKCTALARHLLILASLSLLVPQPALAIEEPAWHGFMRPEDADGKGAVYRSICTGGPDEFFVCLEMSPGQSGQPSDYEFWISLSVPKNSDDEFAVEAWPVVSIDDFLLPDLNLMTDPGGRVDAVNDGLYVSWRAVSYVTTEARRRGQNVLHAFMNGQTLHADIKLASGKSVQLDIPLFGFKELLDHLSPCAISY